ncbi:MAG TPA: hypothetical protein VLS85_12010, partial [Hanamia sp.]|nr:hypothetical protein [Hanamia sp.]
EHSLQKIKELKSLINSTRSSAKIEVDGGISLENAADIINAGADILVAGSSVFKSENPTETIRKMKEL